MTLFEAFRRKQFGILLWLRHETRSLLRHLREGREHSLWCNPRTGAVEAVPRHTEVPNLLAKKICKNLSIPTP